MPPYMSTYSPGYSLDDDSSSSIVPSVGHGSFSSHYNRKGPSVPSMQPTVDDDSPSTGDVHSRVAISRVIISRVIISRVKSSSHHQSDHQQSEVVAKQMEQTTMVPVNRVWDSVQLYSVQCEECSKGRLIPSKEKYEEIRATFNETTFTCATVREWRPQVSCEDPADVEDQDEKYCWAMDKPNIPRTPLNWQRLLRVRTPGGSKFADVHYVAPSNIRFRSMVELGRFFDQNPAFLQGGINTSHFSFQAPVPLDENYIIKRRSRAPTTSCLRNMSNVPSEDESKGVHVGVPKGVSTEASIPAPTET
ncbi:hypothetical protein RD792_003696 [Penstemon davidsonii]|uniref:Uncharacterized protein n=1 Tax=Penstemon davidsonii TaxID=160366 RepID=A0ABR0DGU8_9LAMI|nr:hypothetical protein RD792_003696 [Penstemon davidsonii]